MLVEKTENILAPWKSVEAALSHTLPQHAKQFFHTDGTLFHDGRNHAQVRQHRRVRQGDFVQRETIQFHLDVVACCGLEISLA